MKKSDLTAFLRLHNCKSTDPQPRHLGTQRGLYFLVQGCWHPCARRKLKAGEYCLMSFNKGVRVPQHRSVIMTQAVFDDIKKEYDSRCAVCGSPENEYHYKQAHLITSLQKGHCNPRLPLTAANCIPICAYCNRVYKNNAVFNKRGIIVKLFTK